MNVLALLKEGKKIDLSVLKIDERISRVVSIKMNGLKKECNTLPPIYNFV